MRKLDHVDIIQRERGREVSCRNPKLRVTALNDLWDKQHSVKVRLCIIHYVQVRETKQEEIKRF